MIVNLDNPQTVPAPPAHYSHLARIDLGSGALLFLAGQLALDASGEVVAPGDVRAQADRILAVTADLLAAHGGSLADVVHIRTFMTDLGDLPGYAEVRARHFPGTPPASTTVEVSKLFRDGAVLEVEITAAVPAR